MADFDGSKIDKVTEQVSVLTEEENHYIQPKSIKSLLKGI